jgi:hypothetical protein
MVVFSLSIVTRFARPRAKGYDVRIKKIYLKDGHPGDAEALLMPAVSSGDAEVAWRLADVLVAMGRLAEADVQLEAARFGFQGILEKHLLAFADHGAEFYSGSGADGERAFELASLNLANRPTLRAFEQAYEIAVAAGQPERASEILGAAKNRWGTTNTFRFSPLAECRVELIKNDSEQ